MLLGNCPRLFLVNLSFDLCFYVNGLYFSEDYISERYNSEEKETFLTVIYNSVVRLFIVSIVSWVIENLNKFLLPDEEGLIRNIKIIIKEGEKDGSLTSYKEKQKKYIKAFFIIGIVLEIFALYHMVCVFHHYKYSITNWVILSLVSIFFFNGGSMLITYFMACFRYIGLKYKSPQLYNIVAN